MNDWKTTIAGAASAIFHGLAQVYPEYTAIFEGLSAVSLAVMGKVARDA